MIKVFTGPMFSGKSKGLFQAYDSIFNKVPIMIFKSARDTRTPNLIVTRVGIDAKTKKERFRELQAIEINTFEEIIFHLHSRLEENPDIRIRTILIDEAMLIEGNPDILKHLSLNLEIDFYISGLDRDVNQKPFGLMPQILSLADSIEKVPASCFDCGRDALNTFYTLGELTGLNIGSEGYIPICDRCLKIRNMEKEEKRLVLSTIPKELNDRYY